MDKHVAVVSPQRHSEDRSTTPFIDPSLLPLSTFNVTNSIVLVNPSFTSTTSKDTSAQLHPSSPLWRAASSMKLIRLPLLRSKGLPPSGILSRPMLRHGSIGIVSFAPVKASFDADTSSVSYSTIPPSSSPGSGKRRKSFLGSPVEVNDMEERIEKVIYRCRFFAFLAVSGSLMGSFICFVKGCTYVIDSYREYFIGGGKVVLMLIEAIDIYLVGTVMLVFGMGLYELFISNLDIAKMSSYGSNLLGLFKLLERPRWLEIQSVNELKTKLGHVIVMILLVGMFEKSKKLTISTPTDLLCFAASILLSSGCIYLLSKLHATKRSKHA